MIDLTTNLLGITLDNPIIPASGTFGFGKEFSEFYDIKILGSISTKGATLKARYGNPLPRIAECPAGMINAVGLQNPGIDKVIEEELPYLEKIYAKPVIVNVGGESVDDYLKTVEKLNNIKNILAVELNISCPNVEGGGMAFGTDAKTAYSLIKKVKDISTQKIMVKLSPNVTDIVSIACATQDAGADAVSLINTLLGMRIDLKTAKPVIAVKKGGYSGRGVFPVALKMVYDVCQKLKIPVVGMGGISNAYDVIEMMYAGARAVMVGTENLIDPFACKNIIEQLPQVMEELKIQKLSEIIGRAL